MNKNQFWTLLGNDKACELSQLHMKTTAECLALMSRWNEIMTTRFLSYVANIWQPECFSGKLLSQNTQKSGEFCILFFRSMKHNSDSYHGWKEEVKSTSKTIRNGPQLGWILSFNSTSTHFRLHALFGLFHTCVYKSLFVGNVVHSKTRKPFCLSPFQSTLGIFQVIPILLFQCLFQKCFDCGSWKRGCHFYQKEA